MTHSLPPARGSRLDLGPALTVRLDVRAGHIELIGQLDRGTRHVLHDTVSALLVHPCPQWTVDASRLTVADHAGLRAIGAAYRRALRHGRRLTLQGSSPSLRQALRRLRLARHLLDDQVA